MGSVNTAHQQSAKPYHHGDLRSALIDAALRVLAEEGIDKLSLRSLARRVGVSHNAPYMHFANKDALLQAVADHGYRQLGAAVQDRMSGALDWRAQISAGCQAYVRFALEHPDQMQIMFRPIVPGASRTPSEDGVAALGHLAEAIARAQDGGHIKPGSLWQYAVLLWSLIHGVAEIATRTGADSLAFPDEDIDTRTDWMVRSVLDGLVRND